MSQDWKSDHSKRLVIDNGGFNLRVGTCHLKNERTVVRNMMAIHKQSGEQLYGEELERVMNENAYRYSKPHVRGVLTNFDSQMSIWTNVFQLYTTDRVSKEYGVSINLPSIIPQKSKQKLTEILFEYYGFGALLPSNPGTIISSLYNNDIALVIDSGHSSTYIYPTINGTVLTGGIRRLDIGGRLLTKMLTKMISFKQFRMDEYEQAMNRMKEQVLFVSQCWNKEYQNNSKSTIYYVLPDQDIGREGYVASERDETGVLQTLTLTKERYIIPESFFRPEIIGLQQMGLPDLVMDCLGSVHPDLSNALLENIVLVGGNINIKGFKDRLQDELNMRSDCFITPKIRVSSNKNAIFEGLQEITDSENFNHMAISKSMYSEFGSSRIIDMY